MDIKEKLVAKLDNGTTSAAIFSAGLHARKQLLDLLEISDVVWRPRASNPKADYVIGWGRKSNTNRARNYAKRNDLSFYSLEDGFLHSVGTEGVMGQEGVSIVVDKTGIYYDATQASDLETLLLEDKASNPKLIQRAKNCIQQIKDNNISKYNAASIDIEQLDLPEGKKVLLVDQTAGDMSLKYGYVNDNTFQEMLHAALQEQPDAHIIIRTHVRVIAGKKKSCLTKYNTPKHERIRIINENVNPIQLIKQVDHVYVASSQMGFEALMLGKPVTCFGVPFYAQWGLTDDRGQKISRRQKRCSLEEIFAAAYILYPRYIHPESGKECTLEAILDHFEYQIKNQKKEQSSGKQTLSLLALNSYRNIISAVASKLS